MTIRVLDDKVINQISAGEVVERPASVVKELVENAIDAGSSRIAIDLRNGGKSLIRVEDDGEGMNRQDAMMCLERHATSKIRCAGDLDTIASLGFRGEALPSIASVSRFQVVTCEREGAVGTRIRVDGGTLLDVAKHGGAKGTEVTVRSIFFNVPARRKFLRTRETEFAHALETVLRQALARPDIDFRLTHDDRIVLDVPSTDDIQQRVDNLLRTKNTSFLDLNVTRGSIRVEGLLSPVGVHRSTAKGATYTYVNGRFVRDMLLRRAIQSAYRDIVPKGRHPVVILNIFIDPSEVDVNVHPAKIEVRFRNPRDIVSDLSSALRERLDAGGIHKPNLSVTEDQEARQTSPLPYSQETHLLPFHSKSSVDRTGEGLENPNEPLSDGALPEAHREIDYGARELSGQQYVSETHPASSIPSRLLPVPQFRDLAVIGQLSRTYILCEGGGELVIVDQHAAHERITLHRLHQDRARNMGATQRLLTPLRVELAPARAQLLRDRLDLLESIHLDVEAFGPCGFVVKGLPPVLQGADIGGLLQDIADEIAVLGDSHSGQALIDHFLATMACHNSIRASDALTEYEMRSLLASLDEVDFEVCAHGRPVAISVTASELERRFHRS